MADLIIKFGTSCFYDNSTSLPIIYVLNCSKNFDAQLCFNSIDNLSENSIVSWSVDFGSRVWVHFDQISTFKTEKS